MRYRTRPSTESAKRVEAAVLDMFTDTVKNRWYDEDKAKEAAAKGERYHAPTLPAVVSDIPGFKVGLERLDIRDIDNDTEELSYRGSVELTVVNVENGHTGGHVTVYGPEIYYDADIRWAHTNSSTQSDASVAKTRVAAQMLNVAANIAEVWNTLTKDELEQRSAVLKQEREERQREMELERERVATIRKSLDELLIGDVIVRVTGARKTPIVGQYVPEANPRQILIQERHKNEPTRVSWLDENVKIEVRTNTGRYTVVSIGGDIDGDSYTAHAKETK